MKTLIFDLETVPRTELVGDWHPKTPDEFPPLQFHRIVCIGMVVLDDEYRLLKAGVAAESTEQPRSEEAMVARFVEVASRGMRLVSFNGTGFDIPVIQLRALWHGLTMPFYFAKQEDSNGRISGWSKEYRDRYAGRHLDLCELWSNFGASRRPNLHTLARLCGLPGKMEVDGSDVDRLYSEGLFGTIDRYCLEDCFQSAIVFIRWLHLRGELTTEQARERIADIIKHMDESGDHPAFMAQLNRDKALLR